MSAASATSTTSTTSATPSLSGQPVPGTATGAAMPAPLRPPLSPEQQKALQEKLKSLSPEELREFQKQQCIFCQIVAGKVPSKKIYEDQQILAVMDINPAAEGHLLILPKEHYAIMPQVPEAVLGSLFSVSKKISQWQLRALKASGTSLFIANGLAAGQKAQHFLLHLIPRKEADGVLAGSERVIDEAERSKVIPLVEERFNQLIGLKKTVVRAGKRPEGEMKEKEERGREKIVEAEFEEENKAEKEKEEIVEEEKGRKKRVKKKAEKEEAKEKDEESASEEGARAEEDASLDEIASLFR